MNKAKKLMIVLESLKVKESVGSNESDQEEYDDYIDSDWKVRKPSMKDVLYVLGEAKYYLDDWGVRDDIARIARRLDLSVLVDAGYADNLGLTKKEVKEVIDLLIEEFETSGGAYSQKIIEYIYNLLAEIDDREKVY